MAEAAPFPDYAEPSSDSSTRILLLGRSGSGKSATGNTILGAKLFNSQRKRHKSSKERGTTTCEEQTCHVAGRDVCVVDTPDLLNTDLTQDQLKQEEDKLLSLCQAGLNAVLLVIPIDDELQNEEEILGFVRGLFGQNIMNFVIVLFTHGSELDEDETIEQHIEEESEELHQIILSCSSRYHIFDNRHPLEGQVTKLLERIDTLVMTNGGRFSLGLKRSKSMDYLINLAEDSEDEEISSMLKRFEEQVPQIRLVLLGKTGVGKSASGNTILGRKVFKCDRNSASQTIKCQAGTVQRHGKEITVIDTPGLCDTRLSEEEVTQELVKCIAHSSPGPHAFLIVINLAARFTKEEREVIEAVGSLFGKEMEKYTIILFTHRDLLDPKTIEEFLRNGNPELKELVEKCGSRFLGFNNESSSYPQFKTLLSKIESVLSENQGRHYTNQPFQQCEQEIRRVQCVKFKERHAAYRLSYPTTWRYSLWKDIRPIIEQSHQEAIEYAINSSTVIQLIIEHIFKAILGIPQCGML